MKVNVEKESLITQDLLKELFTINESGQFIRNTTTHRWVKGSNAGGLHKRGYLYIGVKGNMYLAHRLAWIYFYGVSPNEFIDHINGVKNDNRIENLRECDYFENGQNRKVSKVSKTGINGVVFNRHKNKFTATISIKGIQKNLGAFDSLEEAKAVREEAEKKYYHFSKFNVMKTKEEIDCIKKSADDKRNKKSELLSNNVTGVNGVSYDKAKRKFKASLVLNKKIYNLGRYNTIEECRIAILNFKQHGTVPKKDIPSNNTSGFKGVSFFKPCKKFAAAITINYKKHHLGYFNTAEEANVALMKFKESLNNNK